MMPSAQAEIAPRASAGTHRLRQHRRGRCPDAAGIPQCRPNRGRGSGRGRVPVIAGCTSLSISATVAFWVEAVAAGADALLCAVPSRSGWGSPTIP
jgi:hypothetical protein